jgi:hypothetical protein
MLSLLIQAAAFHCKLAPQVDTKESAAYAMRGPESEEQSDADAAQADFILLHLELGPDFQEGASLVLSFEVEVSS